MLTHYTQANIKIESDEATNYICRGEHLLSFLSAMVAISVVAITMTTVVAIIVVAITVAIIVVPFSTESVNKVVQSIANVVAHICSCGGATKCSCNIKMKDDNKVGKIMARLQKYGGEIQISSK